MEALLLPGVDNGAGTPAQVLPNRQSTDASRQKPGRASSVSKRLIKGQRYGPAGESKGTPLRQRQKGRLIWGAL